MSDPEVSVLNKHLIVPIEDVPSLKDSVDGTFETLLKPFFALAGPALQSALFAISVCQTAANWTKIMNNQHDPVFQDCVVAEQLQLPFSFFHNYNFHFLSSMS